MTAQYKVVSAIYSNHNKSNALYDSWKGWNILWKMKFALKVIFFFLWKIMHGSLSTFSYLYRIKAGSNKECLFCGLISKTSEHLIWDCCKVKESWRLVEEHARVNLNLDSREIAMESI